MQALSPRFLEWDVLCQQGEKRGLLHIFVELTDADRQQWTSEQTFNQLEQMKRRTGILSILPDDVTPIETGCGKLIDHAIDNWVEGGTKTYARGGRKAWIVRWVN
jgi:hypothetical protein